MRHAGAGPRKTRDGVPGPLRHRGVSTPPSGRANLTVGGAMAQRLRVSGAGHGRRGAERIGADGAAISRWGLIDSGVVGPRRGARLVPAVVGRVDVDEVVGHHALVVGAVAVELV